VRIDSRNRGLLERLRHRCRVLPASTDDAEPVQPSGATTTRMRPGTERGVAMRRDGADGSTHAATRHRANRWKTVSAAPRGSRCVPVRGPDPTETEKTFRRQSLLAEPVRLAIELPALNIALAPQMEHPEQALRIAEVDEALRSVAATR
jgi:hypothetical protein